MPQENRFFLATGAQAGLTVLAALRQWMPGTSWSAVRKLMAQRRVAVNELLCLDETRRIKEGDAVTLTAHDLEPPPSSAEVHLAWVDDEVIVVEKPAGMITLRHPVERNWSFEKKRLQPALDDVLPELLSRAGNSPRRRDRPTRIYAVHRIDRGTSGLLVFARTPHAREYLVKQFRKHTVDRVYMAVAEGEVAAQTFDSFLVADRGDGRRGSTKVPGTGKRAVTHVRPIARLEGFTVLECCLETGRTHQIRIHLSEAGHPIYGDMLYGNAASDTAHSLGMGRLALHAATLGFDHPKDGRRLRFESPLSDDLASLIHRLR